MFQNSENGYVLSCLPKLTTQIIFETRRKRKKVIWHGLGKNQCIQGSKKVTADLNPTN